MAQVTVCIPGYRCADFIRPTLASVAAQTFTDYRVLLGLEPDEAAETVAAAGTYLADRRFAYYVNDRRLGWAGNVGALLERVHTPYFVILPHDDMWHPQFLADQLVLLSARYDAAGTYTDLWTFGGATGVHRIAIDDGPLYERVLSFLLESANGFAWSGVTRRSALDRPFPTNAYDSFAVESEWVLRLLKQGPLLHVPRALYIKRQPDGADQTSVSRGWRVRTSPGELRDALEHHRRQMLSEAATLALPRAEAGLVELATEAAMVRRFVTFNNARFDFSPADRWRVAALLRSCAADRRPAARAIESRLHVSLARYHAQRRQPETSLRHARMAVSSAPDSGEAISQLAVALLGTGRVMEALPVAREAARARPMAMEIGGLRTELRGQVDAIVSAASAPAPAAVSA
jgi:glycosyl transferase family 2